MNGKGDKIRPRNTSLVQYEKNWNRIFGIKCPHCKIGTLELIKGFDIYDKYYQCNRCDSTYTIQSIE